ESAISIDNYTAVAPTSQTLNIRIEESQTEAKLNIITFYYTENEVTINYKMVGPNGVVSDDLTAAYGSITSAGETLKVLSGTAQGSTATANEGFRFVGWYSDKDCTTNVSDNAAYVPTKADGTPWTAATYYAKFEYDVADLTIVKDVGAGDPDGSFIFHVTINGKITDVVITTKDGKGEVVLKDLTVGTAYTITEDTNWSWRYSCNEKEKRGTVEIPGSEKNRVTFQNSYTNDQWLSDTYTVVNIWTSEGKITKKETAYRRKSSKGKED
ncbi:DUF5979 domain-containing protein, partial [Dysosmobacter sp.]|uniref:DUF5979 domain-containing protein n=1 Tax=Dysosmobacter sp. TaxID=2591382 RepID=UPI002A8FCEA3